MGFLNRLFGNKEKNLVKIIVEFLNTSRASDVRRLLEQYPDLLSEDVDSMLNAFSKSTQPEEIINLVYSRRKLLAHCRKVGISQTFDKISILSCKVSAEDLQMMDFQMILDEIHSYSKPQDMPRKINVLQHLLSLVQRQSNPSLWAALQMELGSSIRLNPQGNRVKDTDKAIELYNQALEVYTHQNSIIDWATIQNNLAIAYCNRVTGDRAENIEQAIKYYNRALEVFIDQELLIDLAMTQVNLASAYIIRISGDKAKNIEQAIELYNQALKVYAPQFYSFEWAATQNNLANAYSDRIEGDRAENIDKAIEHYNQALTIRTQENLPTEWAATQNNLANAYQNRIKGNRADNIEKAIEHFNLALKVRTRGEFPIEWAETQNNLAVAYEDYIRGNRAENIEKAIGHYNQALEVYIYQGLMMNWAETQNNLASAYSHRIIGDQTENIEKAIEHYDQALTVRTRENFPIEWAVTHNNLANAYRDRIKGNRSKNIEHSINHYHYALEIFKLESMPDNYRRTHGLLGDLYLAIDKWKNAAESYKEAIKAGNLLYRAALSSESKSIEVEENAGLYQNASLATYRLGMSTEALLLLERGKTRLLNEALQLKVENLPGIPKEEWIKYERAAEKYRNSIKPSDSKEDYTQREKRVKKSLEELNNAIKVVQSYNPRFQKELEISDILSIPARETALLTFCITDKGSIGFVVSQSSGIQSVDIPSFKTEDLNSLLLFKSNDEQGFLMGGWISDYISYLSASEEALNDAFHTWQITLNNVLSSVGSQLLSPLLAELPSHIKKLILFPSGGLFLLPLHAIPLPDGQLLCQRYCISYAPSIQLFKEMQNKVLDKGKDLYAVINPQEDFRLVFSGCEGQAISKLFQSHQVNVGKTGTKATVLEGLLGRSYLHFSCHGSYNWIDPLQSGLHLVGGRTLSLADLQNEVMDMTSARLVTLSACETGITDIVNSSADEFVGLPAGFMLAGVPCVVSSLWSVPEISTALLMERFYFNHIKRDMDIPMALQEAQLWVRDLTSGQVADYVEKCYHSGKWEGKSKDFIEQYRERYHKMAEGSTEEKPFEHPYYWAAFTVNGA